MKPADTLLASLGVLCILIALVGDTLRSMSLVVRVFLGLLGFAAIGDALLHQARTGGSVSQRPCLPTFLLLSAIGFGAGLVMGRVGSGRPHWSRFGWDVSVILRARHFSPQPENRFPRLPGAVLLALLLSSVPLLNGDCPGFLGRHVLFSIGFLACGVSIGAWLMTALAFQRDSDAQRTEDIEQFLSDSAAPVPPPVPGFPPMWLRAWNWLNVGLFCALMASTVLLLTGIGINH
jgi:hypothetical protein